MALIISGKDPIKLLQKDGWVIHRHTRHGVSLSRFIDGRNLVTVIPDSRANLPSGTLLAILGPKQTCLGRHGLTILLDKYGK